MVPAAAFDYTFYDLEDQPDDESSNPDRAAPIVSGSELTCIACDIPASCMKEP